MRSFPLLLAAALVLGINTRLPAADVASVQPTATNATTPAMPDATPAPVDATATSVEPAATSVPTAETPPTPTPAPQSDADEGVAPAATTAAGPEKPAGPDPAPIVVTAQIDPELALRLSLLEKTLLAQSQGQAAIYAETTRLLMFFGSACVAMGLIAMVAAVFLMNRTLASVSAITAQVAHAQVGGGVPALPPSSADVPAAPAQPAGFERVQASGQRFQSRMTSLEQRLGELEHLAGHGGTATAPTQEPAGPEPAVVDEPAPAVRRVVPLAAILVRKSETLINLGKLDEAMAALDEAARHEGDPAEVHLARGRVLEKMGRLGDALQSYDVAVNNDQSSTAALLMKAGVLNRQERFDEALNCYERALAVHRANN